MGMQLFQFSFYCFFHTCPWTTVLGGKKCHCYEKKCSIIEISVEKDCYIWTMSLFSKLHLCLQSCPDYKMTIWGKQNCISTSGKNKTTKQKIKNSKAKPKPSQQNKATPTKATKPIQTKKIKNPKKQTKSRNPSTKKNNPKT